MHGLDKNGQLYKVNYFEFYRDEDVIKLADDPDYDQAKFEEKLEIKGDNDHTKLIAMLNDLNDYSVPMSEILGKYFRYRKSRILDGIPIADRQYRYAKPQYVPV